MIIKDHKDSINRELSLVEQKKMQWAKEREEMAKLEQYHSKLQSKYERNTIRTQLITNTEIVHQNNNNFHQKNFNMRRLRSPSLPPIERYDKAVTRQGSNNSDQSSGYLSGSGGNNGGSSLPANASTIDTHSHYDYNLGQTHFDSVNKGHTSKYSLASSSLNEYPSSNNERDTLDYENAQKPIGTPSSESSVTSQDIFSVSSYANSSTIDSSINYQKSREGRAKWGLSRGSYLFDSYSKNDGRSSRNTTGPVWLEKSLSEARDSEEETMSISVHSVSSYLRGQNVPIDPFVLAEREAKRRKAMELQQAIKEQLEERENLKKAERERQWQQERLEEERLARQIDIEKQRLEKEQKMQNEKLENQRKKEESMKKALEKAALDAQMERERKRKEKALALQNSLDETISIQKIGERTEIFIEGCQISTVKESEKFEEREIQKHESKQEAVREQRYEREEPVTDGGNQNEKNEDDDDDEDDGETILIGTPIKLKKKNLENFRRKFNKRLDESKTSDEELSSPKTIKSVDSGRDKFEDTNNKSSATKTISDLEGIAIVLQTMPMVPTFVPLTNEMFGFNQLNNLAFLMTAQNRLNSPSANVMLPIIQRDISTPGSVEKLDLSQLILPQQMNSSNNSSTITLQIQQVDNNNNNKQSSSAAEDKVKTPSTPELLGKIESEIIAVKKDSNETSQQQVIDEKFKPIPTTPPQKDTNKSDKISCGAKTPCGVPHDGTFTKDDSPVNHPDEFSTIRVLTPQKYRTCPKQDGCARTVATQTESFLFCEYCSYKHHTHHHHRCAQSNVDDGNAMVTAITNTNGATVSSTTNTPAPSTAAHQHENAAKTKEKKGLEERPKWGARKPPMKYLKASERDPFYGKNRKKRYLKKAASESDRNDDSCGYKECPLIRSPLLPRRCIKQQTMDDLCSNLLPIKTDRFGRVCLVDEQNFIMNEAMKRMHRSEYTSDTESSIIDMKQKSFFLPRASDFQNVFVD